MKENKTEVKDSVVVGAQIGTQRSKLKFKSRDIVIPSIKTGTVFTDEVKQAITNIEQILELSAEQKNYLVQIMNDASNAVQDNNDAAQSSCKEKFKAFMLGAGNVAVKIISTLSGLANLAKFFGLA